MNDKTIFKLCGIVVLFILFVRFDALAGDGCQNPKTSYDRTYCTAKLFLESDKELNDVYKELKGKLNSDLKKRLTITQREWIEYRNNSCEFRGTIDVQCNYDVNRSRTEFLRDRLRECKTGHCREDLIPQKSWKD
jgi:uncharacterized protein YecT (DUF1311 family)